MWNKKIFPQKRFNPYLEIAKTFMVFLDELETYGKLEAKNWAHIPHVQTQAAFELSDEAFQVKATLFIILFTFILDKISGR